MTERTPKLLAATDVENRLRVLRAQLRSAAAAQVDSLGASHPVRVIDAVLPRGHDEHGRNGRSWRTATTGDARQVIGEGDGLLLVVDIEQTVVSGQDGLRLRGQVLGLVSIASVQASSDGVEHGIAVVDEFGEFELVDLPSGFVDLVVADGVRELVLAVEL